MNKKTIEISRSFSKKWQEQQYQPIEFFASVKKEVEEEEVEKESKRLSEMVVRMVEEDLNAYKEKVEKIKNRKNRKAELKDVNFEVRDEVGEEYSDHERL